MEPLDCSTCKMEERCERTREVCKYPEGRKYGVVHRRISELEHLRARVSELEAALENITLISPGALNAFGAASAIATEALRGKK